MSGVADNAVGAILEIPPTALQKITAAERAIAHLADTSQRAANAVKTHWGVTALQGFDKFIDAMQKAKDKMGDLGNVDIKMNVNTTQTTQKVDTATAQIQKDLNAISATVQTIAQSFDFSKPMESVRSFYKTLGEAESGLKNFENARRKLDDETPEANRYNRIIELIKQYIDIKKKSQETIQAKTESDADKRILADQKRLLTEQLNLRKQINAQKLVVESAKITDSAKLEEEQKILRQLFDQYRKNRSEVRALNNEKNDMSDSGKNQYELNAEKQKNDLLAQQLKYRQDLNKTLTTASEKTSVTQSSKARLGNSEEAAIQRQLNSDYKELLRIIKERGEIQAKAAAEGRNLNQSEINLLTTLRERYRLFYGDIQRVSDAYTNMSAASAKMFAEDKSLQKARNATLLADAEAKAANEAKDLADKKAVADAKELQRQSEIGRRRNEQYHKYVEAERLLDERRKKAMDDYERQLQKRADAEAKAEERAIAAGDKIIAQKEKEIQKNEEAKRQAERTDYVNAINRELSAQDAVNKILEQRIALQQKITALETKYNVAQLKDPTAVMSFGDETKLQNYNNQMKKLEEDLRLIGLNYSRIAAESQTAFDTQKAEILALALKKLIEEESKLNSTSTSTKKSDAESMLNKLYEDRLKLLKEEKEIKNRGDLRQVQGLTQYTASESQRLAQITNQLKSNETQINNLANTYNAFGIKAKRAFDIKELQQNIDLTNKFNRALDSINDKNIRNLVSEYKTLASQADSLEKAIKKAQEAGVAKTDPNLKTLRDERAWVLLQMRDLERKNINEIAEYRHQRQIQANAADLSAYIQNEAAKTAEAKKQATQQAQDRLAKYKESINSYTGAMRQAQAILNGNGKGQLATNLENIKRAIEQVKSASGKLNLFDPSDVVKAKQLKDILAELYKLQNRYKDAVNVPKEIISPNAAMNMARTATTLRELQAAYKALKDAMNNTNPNDPRWAQMNSQLKLTKEQIDKIKSAMGEMNNQSKNLGNQMGQLKNLIAGAFSVSAIQGFIKKMVETRAQFELQRVALGAIIQDTDRANKMFFEVQQMALMSPFSIMQLERATKQVAAFGFETEKIVPTLKMVADLGAGLGVELDRIVLVMGHLKARGYLEGTMVRQFTNMGFNVLGELAKYYSELEDKMVSVADVQTRVKKKMVEFADVEEVLKRVTSAGGMFYDMQKKQAESLYGQLQRITDAYDLMLNEIGKNNTNMISKALTAIRSLINHWRMLAPTLKTIGYLMAGVVAVKGIIALGWQLNKLGIIIQTLATNWRLVGLAANKAATSMKLAWSSTGIGLLIAGLISAISYFRGVRAEANALKEELDRIGNDSVNNLNSAIVTFKTNADVISNQNKTYLERAEAMKEISRVFADILPKEKMEIDYIANLKGNYEELIDTIQEYYQNKEYQQKYETMLASSQAKDVSDEIERTFKRMNKDGALGMVFPDSQLKAWAEKVANELNTGKIPNSIDAMKKKVRDIFPDAGEIDRYFSETYSKADFTDVFDKVNKVRDAFGDISLATSNADNALEMYIQRLGKMDFNQLSNETEKIQQRMNRLAYQIDSLKKTMGSEEYVHTSPTQKASDTERLKELINQYNEYAKRLSDVEETQVRVLANEFYKSVETETKKLTDLVDAYWTCKIRMEDLEKQGKKNTAEYKSLAKQQEELKKSADEMKDSFTEVDWTLVDNAKTSYELKDVIDNLANNAFPNVAKRVSDAMDTVKKMLAQGHVWAYKFATAVVDILPDNLKSALPDYAGKLKLAESELEVLEGKAKDTAESVDNAAAEAVSESTSRNVQKFGARLERINNITKDTQKNSKDLATELRNEAKGWEETVKAYENSTNKDVFLAKAGLTESEIAQMKKDAQAANAIADEIYGKEDKKSGKGKDTILELWKNRLKAIQDFYKQYENLQKNFSDAESLAKDKDAFTKLFNTLGMDMNEIVGRGMDKKGFAANLDAMLNEVKAIRPQLADEFEKAYADVKVQIDVEIQKDAVENMKKDIQNIADNFELSETFRKLGVSTDLVFMLGGKPTTLEEYKQHLVDTYEYTYKIEKKYGEDGVKAYDDMLKKITDLEQKNAIERAKNYVKYLTESLGERAQIEVKAMQEIQKIREDMTLDDFSKEQAIMQKRKKMHDDLNKVDLDNLKSSDVYVSVFKDLENASREQLQYVINKLRELQSTFKDLSPAQVKSIANDIKKLQDAMDSKNPFEDFGKNLKGTFEYLTKRNELKKRQVELAEEIDAEEQKIKDTEVDLYNANVLLKSIQDQESDEYQEQLNIVTKLQIKLKKSNEDLKKLQGEMSDVTDDIDEGESSTSGLAAGFQKIKSYAQEMVSQLDKIMIALDKMGVMTDAASDNWESFKEGFEAVIDIAEGGIKVITNWGTNWAEVVNGTIQGIQGTISLVAAIFSMGDKKKERQIKKLQDKVEDLGKAYDKLHKSIEDAYTFYDYNAGVKATEENLKAQKQAYQEMKNLEEAKKKTDKEKVKEYEDALDEIAEKEEQLLKDRLEAMGSTTDYLSQAQDFVSAWFDAYKETGDGLEALTDRWDEFVENLFVKQGAAQLVSTRLKKVIDYVNQAIEDGGTDFNLAETVKKATEMWDKEAEIINPLLEQLFGSYGLGKGNGEFVLSDLQKGIQNITEPQAAAIEAYLNSMRFAVFRHTEQLDTLIAAVNAQYGTGENPMVAELKGIRSVLDSIDSRLASVIKSKVGKGMVVQID